MRLYDRRAMAAGAERWREQYQVFDRDNWAGIGNSVKWYDSEKREIYDAWGLE